MPRYGLTTCRNGLATDRVEHLFRSRPLDIKNPTRTPLPFSRAFPEGSAASRDSQAASCSGELCSSLDLPAHTASWTSIPDHPQ